ncbi:hypothetical protein IWW36_004377 [Coemansia brasiliensis]|uniref:RecQ-mediated genome instability protein 1 n=1 Tax=Coemansia brasiliensis TaxID=2650707 RepID=A0A9W8LXN1_9FUNG|nr:hypothetical protein IWW36_004377 [Coemansia brasiliensis]
MIDRRGVTADIRKRYNVVLRPEWLDRCADHIKAELERQNVSATHTLHLEAQTRLVIEQLLHSDISESCFPTLITDGNSNQVSKLPDGSGVLLQIQEIMDVGVSKHAMWEAIREKEDFEQRGIRPSYLPVLEDEDNNGVFAANTQSTAAQPPATEASEAQGERKPKIPHSMLKLVLSDGCSRIHAIEQTPIPQLSVELPVGTKVVVRSGKFLQPTNILCLDAQNIQVLGGTPAQYQQFTLRSRLEGALRVERTAAAAR